MTEPESIKLDGHGARTVSAAGHDLISLVFNFLDAALFLFATEDFLVRDMHVTRLVTSGGVYEVAAACYGEKFEFGRHPQGTEIKAITYSNMQLFTPTTRYSANADEADGGAGGAPAVSATERDAAAAAAAAEGDGGVAPAAAHACRGKFDVFVIVDI